jgi:amino-acid N-acetyltransferase
MKTDGNEFITLHSDKDLHPLFIREGLEVGNEPVSSRFIRILAYKKEDYLAGASLGRRGEYLIVDSIAVDASLHGQGIGKRLMKELLHDLPYDEDLYLMAKAPGFFKKLGFEDLAIEQCPPVFGCLDCEKQGVTCFPQAMVLRRGRKLSTGG